QRIREFQWRELRERTIDGKTEIIETNGIRVMFYPPAFEFPRHALGLRYNENWVAECMKFGHAREQLRLCCLISEAEAVERSWRDADAVPALKAALPKVSLLAGAMVEEPIIVQGCVKAIVTGPHSSLKTLFRTIVNDDP